MNVTWRLLAALSLVCRAESKCSPTSYYKNCWIRRFPGVLVDVDESQRRGAQLLRRYREESALKCSRACCLTRNFSCNLAIFHYDTAHEHVNCFHLHCPSLESCILSHRGNVVLYNITKGVDPDLLVFGKHFTSNVRVLPHHYGRVNASELLPSDKRQFIHPPPPAVPPPTSAPASRPPVTPGDALNATAARHARTRSTAAPSSASAAPPAVTELRAQTAALLTSTASTPTFNVPPSSPAASTRTTSFPTTPAQPPTSTQPHQGTSSSTTIPPTSPEASKQSPNDTRDEAPPGWHAATQSLLVAVAVCVTVLLSCCCSILLVVSWRGQRKRMGRYHTSWRGKKGSMRLIKYVLVRENS
ncbi:MANSC domain-containing protein 4-like [Betta splendens]|uniref:MANSC domain-containing protein 4-like n=1 Tax=Betta splendens TaxID=158456 RepID=A0A6P7MQU1_BETSP|nr:MANSC domain-containing protein 4-like [Betta splendens]